jgi:DNA sulfur modification protein DndC
MGAFNIDVRKELLEELFKIEEKKEFRNRGIKLISNEEIEIIQEYWNTDGDIENSALNLAIKYGRNVKIVESHEIDKVLSAISHKNYSKELFNRIYEVEKKRKNSSIRIGILNEIEERVNNYYRGEFIEN